MEELIPFRFVVKVYPTINHPQSEEIGWTYAHAIVFDGEIENATARLWLALKAAHWQVKDIEFADAISALHLQQTGTDEYALYQRAVQQGFAVDYVIGPKGDPDPGPLMD